MTTIALRSWVMEALLKNEKWSKRLEQAETMEEVAGVIEGFLYDIAPGTEKVDLTLPYNSDRPIAFLTYSGWLRQVKKLTSQELRALWNDHQRQLLLESEYREYLKKAGVIEKN